jgi:hypothetical protein
VSVDVLYGEYDNKLRLVESSQSCSDIRLMVAKTWLADEDEVGYMLEIAYYYNKGQRSRFVSI